VVRPWLVIPFVGAGAGALAYAAHHDPALAVAVALAGAALTAAIRAFDGPSVAAALSAGAGGALGTLCALGAAEIRPMLAGAAAMFAICELARATSPEASPWPAAGAAVAAAVLDPAYVALVAVAGAHVFVALDRPHGRARRPRPRWVLAVPAAGALATVLAIAGALVHHPWFAAWVGHAAHATSPLVAATRAGDLLGPLAATAALAGLVVCATRGRFAAAAVAGVVAMTALGELAGGAAATPLVAGLGAGVAVGRLAALIRWPTGQAFVGATAGFVLVASAWAP
jgi:hypothetical protein